MQGKLLINKPGQIPCGLINNTSNVHLPQQQQPQHLTHQQQQQPNHNGLTYSVSVNTATNRNLMNNNRNLNDNHKKLDRSISEPAEKIILQQAPTLNNKYLLQTATIPQQQSHHNRQRQQQQHTATILATNTTTTSTNIIMKSSTNSNNSSSNNNNNINSNNNSTSSRYKTELCRPFEENGTCKYGDKCQFAHGYHELRNLQRHPRYKTVLCRTFHTVGFCPYGPRCHFIHNSEETKKSIIHTLQTGGPNVEMIEKMTADHSTPSSSPTSSRMLDNLSPSTPTTLLMGASAILNGAFVNNNATTAIGFIANLQQQAQKQLQNGNSTTATGMRPKALSIGSSSLDGSSTSGDLSQPSTPPSGSPASLSSCFDQVPNPFDDSIINNLINSSNNTNNNDIQTNGDHSAFTFRDTLSLCEQKFLSLSLSPLINY